MNEALLIVSFSASVPWVRTSPLAEVERTLLSAVPGLPHYRAYASEAICHVMASRGEKVLSLIQALEQMLADGIDCPLILPTLLVPGVAYESLRRTIGKIAHRFAQVHLAGPLLSTPEDVRAVAEILMHRYAPCEGKNVIFAGHKTSISGGFICCAFQTAFCLAGRRDLFMVCQSGYPALRDVIPNLSAKEILLQPLMLSREDELCQELAGSNPDSLSSQLIQAGFRPQPVLEGLGELAEVRTLYVRRLLSLHARE